VVTELRNQACKIHDEHEGLCKTMMTEYSFTSRLTHYDYIGSFQGMSLSTELNWSAR